MKGVIRATIMADLIVKVFEANGWQFVEGESRAKRVTAAYTVTTDHKRNQYVATPKTPTQPERKSEDGISLLFRPLQQHFFHHMLLNSYC